MKVTIQVVNSKRWEPYGPLDLVKDFISGKPLKIKSDIDTDVFQRAVEGKSNNK